MMTLMRRKETPTMNRQFLGSVPAGSKPGRVKLYLAGNGSIIGQRDGKEWGTENTSPGTTFEEAAHVALVTWWPLDLRLSKAAKAFFTNSRL